MGEVFKFALEQNVSDSPPGLQCLSPTLKVTSRDASSRGLARGPFQRALLPSSSDNNMVSDFHRTRRSCQRYSDGADTDVLAEEDRESLAEAQTNAGGKRNKSQSAQPEGGSGRCW